MTRSRLPLRMALALCAASLIVSVPSSASAAEGQRVSEGEKVPKGTLITGDCWERGGSAYKPANDTANTVIYETDPSLVTVGGVYPKECEPVKVTEVGDYLATTYYYKCSPKCVSTQKDVHFEVVTPRPKDLFAIFVRAAKAHYNSWTALAQRTKRASRHCVADDRAAAKHDAAVGDEIYRDAVVPDHRQAMRALDALAAARKDVKRSKRDAFTDAVDAYRKAMRFRKLSHNGTHDALEAYGAGRCARGDDRRRDAKDDGMEAGEHAKRGNRLMDRVF